MPTNFTAITLFGNFLIFFLKVVRVKTPYLYSVLDHNKGLAHLIFTLT